MKVVFLTTGLSVGGAEVMLHNILSKIDRDRFEPEVVSLMDKGQYGDKIEALGVRVHSVKMLEGKPSLSSAKRLLSVVKGIQPDLIQGWMYHGNIASQFYKTLSRSKIPVVWSIHHSLHQISKEKPLTQSLIRLGALSSKYIEQIAYVSEKSQMQHQKLGYSQHNSCVIPNGFETSRFKPSAAVRSKFRQELGISDDTFLIGSMARYSPMKDHANFIRAAGVLLQDYPDTKFVMIGNLVDRNNQDLTELIAELGIDKSIYLLGLRRDIPEIMPALDLLASSSAFGEAFPLVLGEAMSCGIPCVATDIGDSAFIIGDTGRIVPPKDPQALARGWQEIIDLSLSERAELGEAARKRVINNFALEGIVNRYEQLYQGLIHH